VHVSQHDAETSLFLVLFIQGDLDQRRGFTLEVHFTRHDFQGDHFNIVHLLRGQVVNVRELLTLGVDFEVVGIALKFHQAGVASRLANPRVEGGVIDAARIGHVPVLAALLSEYLPPLVGQVHLIQLWF